VSRIVVLCEGETEELALRFFIHRQWISDGLEAVGLDSRNLEGKIQSAGKFACGYLDEQEVLAVFTLVDLQGMTRVSHQSSDSLGVKIQRVQEWLRAQVNHVRKGQFRPHVCVHETEAWILAEGEALAARLRYSGLNPDPNAELKNFENPPSKRLNELFLRHKSERYKKKIDGTPLFKAMKFEPVYASCKNFQAFYDDLKSVAPTA
jgi:hypothetical protein